MGAHEFDEHGLVLKVDAGNYPVVVALNVERPYPLATCEWIK
jgi:hypothetical protein